MRAAPTRDPDGDPGGGARRLGLKVPLSVSQRPARVLGLSAGLESALDARQSGTGVRPSTTSVAANRLGNPPVWMKSTLASRRNSPARTRPISPAIALPV